MNETDYVGLPRRLLAALIDNLIWVVLYLYPVGPFIAALNEASTTAALVAFVIYASLWFNYFTFMEWRTGQTLGKIAAEIQVRSLDGKERLSYGQASIRGLLRIVDFFVIGWIMIAASDRKQRLGDKAAKTAVVPKETETLTVRSSTVPVRRGASASAASVSAATGGGSAAAAHPMPDVHWTVSQTWWWLVGGLFLAFFLAPLLILPFDPNLGDPDDASKGGILAAQALLALVLTVIAVGVASKWDLSQVRQAFRRLGLGKYEHSMLGIALGAWFAYFIAAVIFSAFVLQPEQEDISGELGVGDANVIVAVIAVALIAVAAPFSEELFFRGFLFAGLRGRWSLWPAAIVAGLIFGLVHAPTGITTVIPLAGLGVLLCWLYDYTGSLWPCVLVHVINNGLALALSPLAEDVIRPLIG